MRNITKLLYLCLACIGLVCMPCQASHSVSDENHVTANKPVCFGDPFILLHNDTYYAYGTAAADGISMTTASAAPSPKSGAAPIMAE